MVTPSSETYANCVNYFLASVSDLFGHASQNVSDMVGADVNYEVNKHDRSTGISFRRNDQLSGNVILSV